jgi:hypothetical protein
VTSSDRNRFSFTARVAVCLLSAACSIEAADARPAAALSDSALFGQREESVRRVLSRAPIAAVNKGSGGRSLAFKLTFRDGLAAYFKPEQSFAANWYSEVASYYLDRELGLRRVPPAIGRRIEWSQLAVHAGEDFRLDEVVIRDGSVRGSLVFWLAERPVPVELPHGWEAWLRIDQRPKVSPFQSLRDYRRALKSGKKSPSVPELDAERAAELSDLIVFDHLIGNIDRWSKDFVNVLTIGPDKRLVFLDNANGFEVKPVPSKLLAARLAAVERFRKKTIFVLRAFDLKKLERRMASDPLAPLLDAAQLAQLAERRAQILKHVATLEGRYGAAALPW